MVGMRIADVQEDIDHELISKEEISDIINCAAHKPVKTIVARTRCWSACSRGP